MGSHTKILHDSKIPPGLKAYFREYDMVSLDFKRNANLIIQRILEYGDWDDVRWLFKLYGTRRVRSFLRQFGERWLRPVSSYYWR